MELWECILVIEQVVGVRGKGETMLRITTRVSSLRNWWEMVSFIREDNAEVGTGLGKDGMFCFGQM